MDTLTKRKTTSIVVIVLVVCLLSLIAFYATPFLLHLSNMEKINTSIFFMNRLFVWLVLIILCCYLKFVAHEKLLAWPESQRKISFYILSTVIILIVLFAGSLLLSNILILVSHSGESPKFLAYIAILKNNIPLLLFTAFTAAVTEELMFRGYIQTRLDRTCKSPIAGIIISALLFAIVHLSYGTLSNFIIPFFIGMVFAFFYWKYRNIKILILCHFLWDVFALLLAIKNH